MIPPSPRDPSLRTIINGGFDLTVPHTNITHTNVVNLYLLKNTDIKRRIIIMCSLFYVFKVLKKVLIMAFLRVCNFYKTIGHNTSL